MRYLRLFLFSAFLVPGLLFSSEQGSSTATGIATVDLAKVFEAHPETATATRQLTKDREAARKKFKESSNALKKVLQEHQEKIRAGKRTEAAERLKKANELEKQIATLRTTQQRDLEEKFRKAKHGILDAIRTAVREYNKDGKFAVVLDRSATSSFGLPAVIDASGAEDITGEIIEKLKARVVKSDE